MKAIEYRHILEERLDRLMHRYGRIDDARHDVGDSPPIEMVERGQTHQNDDVLDRLDETTRAELQAVRGALERVERGDWEKCETCGHEIEHERLRALVTTRHCAGCANASRA